MNKNNGTFNTLPSIDMLRNDKRIIIGVSIFV